MHAQGLYGMMLARRIIPSRSYCCCTTLTCRTAVLLCVNLVSLAVAQFQGEAGKTLFVNQLIDEKRQEMAIAMQSGDASEEGSGSVGAYL